MKKIVSLHPVYACEPGFFNRDFGQIGYTFQNELGYKSETWSLKKKGQKNFEIKGQKWLGFKNKFYIYFNLFLKAPQINILHLYHIDTNSFICSLLYKLRNGKGTIYIKMDTPLFSENIDYREEIKKVNKFVLYIFFKLIKYIGFEDKILLDFYKNNFNKYKNKFIFTTNGAIIINKYIGSFKKENLISLCGRFGTKQKNNELLLYVLEKYNINFLKDWKFNLIGNYTDNFIKSLEKLFIKKPEIKKQIVLKGFINNKSDLYEEMSKSKIFLHTANFEGDPNIQYDAMFCGCFMISTDVANIKQNYLEKYSIFYKIKNEKELYKSLNEGVKEVSQLNNKDYINIQNHCLKNFTWEKILSFLIQYVNNKK